MNIFLQNHQVFVKAPWGVCKDSINLCFTVKSKEHDMVSQILDFEASFGPSYRHKSGCYGLRVKCPFGEKLGNENGDRGSHIIL